MVEKNKKSRKGPALPAKAEKADKIRSRLFWLKSASVDIAAIVLAAKVLVEVWRFFSGT